MSHRYPTREGPYPDPWHAGPAGLTRHRRQLQYANTVHAWAATLPWWLHLLLMPWLPDGSRPVVPESLAALLEPPVEPE